MEKEAILHIPLSQFAFAEKEDRLVIRIRCKKGDLKRCVLLWGDRVAMEEPLPVKQSEMEHVASDMLYDYYEVKIRSYSRTVPSILMSSPYMRYVTLDVNSDIKAA